MKTEDNVKIIKLIQPYCPKNVTEEVLQLLLAHQDEEVKS